MEMREFMDHVNSVDWTKEREHATEIESMQMLLEDVDYMHEHEHEAAYYGADDWNKARQAIAGRIVDMECAHEPGMLKRMAAVADIGEGEAYGRLRKYHFDNLYSGDLARYEDTRGVVAERLDDAKRKEYGAAYEEKLQKEWEEQQMAEYEAQADESKMDLYRQCLEREGFDPDNVKYDDLPAYVSKELDAYGISKDDIEPDTGSRYDRMDDSLKSLGSGMEDPYDGFEF